MDRKSNNRPDYRYADAFLIAAEAEARLNGNTAVAHDFINIIRRRAVFRCHAQFGQHGQP
ncbi:RagB/SusD family nutrient uptake outer membrane protein [Spirosoma validum]|uniref:RagB/SusD family nutrient uptake outer membrane protein n=1 Tax=Spirosoma validum TaxID=2771355 RepID=A0A927B0J2_9BACT|nr:RagB/SusD family nutrient uptake outer membrane protein [Spirosoma validum]MBD2753042.1 RagB/SusD family nutrient uptake outer membrane protein [Spirosoma validum]